MFDQIIYVQMPTAYRKNRRILKDASFVNAPLQNVCTLLIKEPICIVYWIIKTYIIDICDNCVAVMVETSEEIIVSHEFTITMFHP